MSDEPREPRELPDDPPGALPEPSGYSVPPPPPPPGPPSGGVPPMPPGTAPAPAATPVAPATRWYPLQGLATALTVLFWLAAVDAVFAIGALVNRINVVTDALDDGIGFTFLTNAQDADDKVQAALIIGVALSLAVLVLIIIWTWRAAKNNETLGRRFPRFSPGWTIAGWLIPLANLVLPVLVLQDLWRGSDPHVLRDDHGWRSGPGSGLVGWYWTAFVPASVRFYGGGSEETGFDVRNHLRSVRTGDSVALAGSGFGVVAAVLGVQVVRRITRRQEECARIQGLLPA